MKELWVEKYRPKTVEDYVFMNPKQQSQIKKWSKDKSIPHLLLSGIQGTVKTTLAKVLLKELKVHSADILEINASSMGNIDDIRDLVMNFVSTISFGDCKYVLLDEADYMSPKAQGALRNAMETYVESSRFILTCNYPNKILPALHSRCQGFHIDKLDITEFTARIATILIEEDVVFDIDTLDTYVKSAYPDMRKCINNSQMNSATGSLLLPNEDEASNDYKLEIVALFKEGMITQAREKICSNIQPNEYEDIYTFLYQNLEFWGDTKAHEDAAVSVIRKGIVDHSCIADPEICLSDTLRLLEKISNVT